MNLDDFVADHLNVVKFIGSRQIFHYGGKFSAVIHDSPLGKSIQGLVGASKAFDAAKLHAIAIIVDAQMATFEFLAPEITRRNRAGIFRRQPLNFSTGSHSVEIHDGPDNIETR